LLGLRDGHLGLIILDRIIFDNGANAGERRLAGLAVDLHADVHLGAVAALGGAGERLFHRLDHKAGVDHLLARNGFGRLQKLELVS
jgi:hypothetical protein